MTNRRDLLKFFTAAPMCLNALPQAAKAQDASRVIHQQSAPSPGLQWLGIVVGESSIEDCVGLATDLVMPNQNVAAKNQLPHDSGSMKLRRPEGQPNSWALSVSNATVLHSGEDIIGMTTTWLDGQMERRCTSDARTNEIAVVCFAPECATDSDMECIRELCDTVLSTYSSLVITKVLVVDTICGVTKETWSNDSAEWGGTWDGIQFNHTANCWMGSRGIWLGRPRTHCVLQWFKPSEIGTDFADYAHFIKHAGRYVTMYACVDEVQQIEAAVRLIIRDLQQIKGLQSDPLCWAEFHLPQNLMNLENASQCMNAVQNEVDNAVFAFPSSYYRGAERPGMIALSLSL